MKNNIYIKDQKFIYLVLSILFVLTVQQFDLYKGGASYLVHSIKSFDDNKLQNDWIANQQDHLPLFTYFNYLLIKFFSENVIYIIHSILLGICPFFLYLISKNLYPKITNINFCIIWFTFFIFIFHENSFFSGVAGQRVIDAGYQPSSFGTLFFLGIYLFLIKRIFLSIFFICLSASFHPTYILHSGFLVFSFITYTLVTKKYVEFFKISIFYIILILPITLFIIFNFMTIDKDITLVGQEILLGRIPHHANIHYWFTYKDLISLFVYFFSLYLLKNNFKFFIIFGIFGFCSIILSFIQFFFAINSLALAFPWRTSVFLIPISSLIIMSYFINKIKVEDKRLKFIALSLILVVSLFFSYKSHYAQDLNSKFSIKLKLTSDIKKNFSTIDNLLIPVSLEDIRMNTGLPIFIDWKHHAFRYDQLIEWRLRIDLADNFYRSRTYEEQLYNLNKIQQIDNISHILIKKDDLKIECKNLISHKIFALVSTIECFADNNN